ncbi:ABC transporter permease [Metamycoplasma alkalescens]|uniref:FtsX-like permease family protein n=6 Tax=Metamycoplasma alkalescens TaxID=45363 RepID=A0A318UJR6_9BACT|nr:ABC transporter permease [Metamycoplasma alkalescens]PYF43663.1 FtsX-like permease family protein [Metamycoplasma alkalescens]
MKRLFKEVFRSLSKNKVTLVCLTILIFLTTFLFTLLNDVRTSYSRTINAYDKVSKLHDLTVDLDLNPSGIIPHNGYDQIGEDNVTKVNEPIKFEATPNSQSQNNNEKQVTYTLNLPADKQNYLKISDIGKWDVDQKYKNFYISTQDFLKLYYEEINGNITSTKFAINNKANTTEDRINEFSFSGGNNNNKKFKVYTNKNGKFELVKETITLKNSEKYEFKSDVTLGDILTISFAARGAFNDQATKDAVIDASPLFINVKTKEASFKTSDYDQWRDEGILHIIPSTEVLKLLGFEKDLKDNKWYFKKDNNSELKLQDDKKTTESQITASDKLEKNFTLKQNNISVNSPAYVELKSGTNYTIPKNWIRKSEKLVTYNWYRYILNWNEIMNEEDSNWKGSYFRFITNFKNNYKTDYDNKLYFSYWDKTITMKYSILDGSNKFQEIIENEKITKDDLNRTFKRAWEANVRKPNQKIPANKLKNDNLKAWTIKDIEFNKIGQDEISNEDFEAIADVSKLKKHQDFIRNNTVGFAKVSILKNIQDRVGKDNLGIRKTITVETVNEENSKKNVFHFVDMGDKNKKINGFENNVGRLYHETLNPGWLNQSISNENVDSFLLKPDKNSSKIKKLPSVYTRSLISSIFRNFTPDINYFNADIRFENYYDFFRSTQIPNLVNGKILVLTTADDEEKANGSSVIGAIAMPLPDKYIVLKQSHIDGFSDKKVWNKIIVENKDYLSLDEVYQYLIKNNYTIRAEIGENGWAVVSDQFRNSISLPISFGAISNDLTQEIIQKNTIKTLIEQLQSALIDTDFGKLFKRQDIVRLFRAISDSIEANGFHTLLSIGKTNRFIFEKTMLDVIKYLVKPINQTNTQNLQYVNINANSFLHNFFRNIFKYFKMKYVENDRNDQYIVNEINKLAQILSFNKMYIIPQLKISLSDLLGYIENKEKIFDVLSELISSIDFVKFSVLINDWFDKHPYKPFTAVNDTYWTMSRDRMLISFLASVNENQFKNSLKDLINLVDFSKFLKPDLNEKSSYFAKWVAAHKEARTLNEEDKNQVEKFFRALDAKKDGSYSNIREGLSTIISNISLEKFTASLGKLIRHVKYPITANNKIYNDYNTEELNKFDYLAAFMSSINSGIDNNVSFSKINQIQNAIIQILNLSNKTQQVAGDILNIAIPSSDDGKISLLDLGVLPKLAFPKNPSSTNVTPYNISINGFSLVDIKKIISKVENAITSKTLLKLTQSELNFIKNEALIKEIELNNLNLIKDKLNKYYQFIEKIQLKKLKPTNDKYDFKDSKSEHDVDSYGDLTYWSAMIDSSSSIKDLEIVKKIHSLLAEYVIEPVFMGNKEYDVMKNHFKSYSLWIKLAYFLNRIERDEDKITIDEPTGNKIIEKQHKKVLSFDQITGILNELYLFGKKEKVVKAMTNYENVVNPIPSKVIFGSDSQYNATVFKIPYAHAHTNLANKELEKLLDNSTEITEFKNNLRKNHNIKDEKLINKIVALLKNNSYEITYNLGYIATASQSATNYDGALNKFINSFLNTKKRTTSLNPLINDDYEFDLAFKMAIDNTKLGNYLSTINVPNNLLNPMILLSFPQIPLYYGLSPNPNEGNLAYIVKKMMDNLRFSNIEDIKKQIQALTHEFDSSIHFVESKNDSAVDLDISSFNHLFNNVLRNENGGELEIFGINITTSIKKALFKIVQPIQVSNLISYTDSGSYLAKVNYGYANKNGKEVYTGDISQYLNNPYGMQVFIASLDDKYKIKINTQEYLIIGIDSSTDYLYPVVNEENIQVDPSTQAIVYVNSKGFDRIFSAYPTFAIKEYALVKAPVDDKGKFIAGSSPEDLKKEFSEMMTNINPNSFNKVYLKDEMDSINPERKIRVVTIRSIINSIRNASIYLISILIILVAFIIYFIMKRYIEARNKVVGILRAQGYKTSKIALAFCAFGWIPVVVGGFFGYILGFSLQKPAMNVLASYWTLENNIIPINVFSLLGTILVPFLFVSILIFIITSISVSKKPIELMSGIVEVNVGNLAQRVSAMFRKLPVKIRFIASMALNNFWKMFSLLLAFSTTSLISMFFLSSNNIFNKAIKKTYEDRLYKFKLDLESPTTEGGPYVTYNKDDINSLLYVPNDLAGNASSNGSQLDYSNPNFLRPGNSFNTDVIQKKFEPVVLTKSSLDILLDLSVELSPWDITYANMPETQRARVSQIFKRVSKEMQNTQYLIDISKIKTNENYLDVSNSKIDNIIAVTDLNKFKEDLAQNKEEDMSNRTSYFIFTSSEIFDSGNSGGRINEQFKFVEWNPTEQFYQKPKAVSTSRYRQEYRNFLVNAYRKIQNLDFFVSFAGIYWNDTTNEKYTYAKAKLNNKELKIYGYYDDSRFISIRNHKHENLQKKLVDFAYDESKNIPIIINAVAAKKYGLGIGSVIEMDLLNHVDRFSHKALNQKAPETHYKFEVIDISDTYINEEFITQKHILDKILGYDTLSKRLKDSRQLELENAIFQNPNEKEKIQKIFDRKYDAFNGILSNDLTPVQTIDTLTTYSSTGFWGAAASFEVEASNDQAVWEFFKRVFISDERINYVSVYEHNINAYNEAHPEAKLDYKDVLFKLLEIDETQFAKIVKEPNSNEEFKNIARNVLSKFYGSHPGTIYGKNIMYGASFDVNSKDIEAGFISGISKTVNIILIAFIVVSLLISIIILIVITNIMIASNKKAIATFSVLGYTNREKVMLFFANFIPTILFACFLMIPVTLVLISVFNAFMMATSQIVLPLVLNYSTIIISITICLTVFALTSMLTWRSLNKVKAVDALKGK